MRRRLTEEGVGKAGEPPPQLPAAPAVALSEQQEQNGEPQLLFDESDWPAEFRISNGGSQKLMNVTSSFAHQLLLVSLLEHLCQVYAQDPARSRRLFQLLCKTFTDMRLISSFASCDEFSSLRLQHNRAITELMKAANQQILSKELENGSLCSSRKNEVIFEAQTSRYINEFDEISRLGKGGYGTVYKVRNKLDGQFYAIKKIIIEKATKRDCMKVLREVKVLAELQHPNIVGYHTAWMEHVQPACPKGRPALQLPSIKMSSGSESIRDLSSVQDMDDSNSIIFTNLTPESSTDQTCEGNKMNVCELSGDTQPSSSISEEAHESEYLETPSSGLHHSIQTGSACSAEEVLQEMLPHKQCEMEYHVMLHIQMQLCELSLWDWITDRNQKCCQLGDPSNPYCHVDVNGTLKIFQELLEGMYYIHSRGVMHRDIKPRNIFLQGPDHHVKIGDFGLACRDIIQETTSHLLTTKMELPPVGEIRHTSGVGTCLYASPEQLQGSHYDFKSDMYSLGVVLFELFQPFGTEMERTAVLMDLRNGGIPLPFSQKWPTQTKYVKLLTSKVPSCRPAASHVLESELFCNTANVIYNLQQKVMQQEEEIKLLNEKIRILLQERESNRNRQLGSPV